MIGKAITTILTANASITGLISNRLFPVNAQVKETEQNFPSIYYIVELFPELQKNGRGMERWRVTILTMSKQYSESWELSSYIRKSLEAAQQTTVEGYRLTDVKINSISDEFEFNFTTYGQTIEVEIRAQQTN